LSYLAPTTAPEQLALTWPRTEALGQAKGSTKRPHRRQHKRGRKFPTGEAARFGAYTQFAVIVTQNMGCATIPPDTAIKHGKGKEEMPGSRRKHCATTTSIRMRRKPWTGNSVCVITSGKFQTPAAAPIRHRADRAAPYEGARTAHRQAPHPRHRSMAHNRCQRIGLSSHQGCKRRGGRHQNATNRIGPAGQSTRKKRELTPYASSDHVRRNTQVAGNQEARPREPLR